MDIEEEENLQSREGRRHERQRAERREKQH